MTRISGTDPAADLFTPREAAAMLGINATTLARWSRQLRPAVHRTPGGHRRYRREDITVLQASQADPAPPETELQRERDMARLYEQGWSIQQVADRFGMAYSTTRRILLRHTTLRSRARPTTDWE